MAEVAIYTKDIQAVNFKIISSKERNFKIILKNIGDLPPAIVEPG
jgi:hypothetical protein